MIGQLDARPAPTVWRPHLGACQAAGGVAFCAWAPSRKHVELVLNAGLPSARRHDLTPAGDGIFTGTFTGVEAGDGYAYILDGDGPYPDPASRFQPQGVHGPSTIVDPSAYQWSDQAWRGVPLREAIVYELHVGAFTPEGTFAGVTARLPSLAELGVTVIELMPVADFPGSRNWGYDGVSLFAPARAYGVPDDLRRLVDTAHGLGLAVLLDVVYNHFGPDGAYGPLFSPFYLSNRHKSPWGAAVNLDGEGSAQVRHFFTENALHWLHEYHFDGLRLDATHDLVDDSPRHFVAELSARVRASIPDRSVLLIAEDDRNMTAIVRAPGEGGWGLDAVWADDFHHHTRRLAAGDSDGYYEDFSGSVADIAATIRQGWFYRGQFSAYQGEPRGTDPAYVPLERMVVCLQNHDQIGNRAFGERLNHQIEPAHFRALSALLLCLPETPLLFMGQEWAASTRFLFFTDHHADLGRLVTEGRRAEFSRFAAFADPATRARIPDPQASSTFDDSRLVWDERTKAPHAGVLALYRTLLRLRRTEAALRPGERCEVVEVDDACLALRRGIEPDMLLLVLCVGTARHVDLRRWRSVAPTGRWEVVLTTEEARFQESGDPGAVPEPTIELEGDRSGGPGGDSEGGPAVTFHRPSAVLLRSV
jgi:maltooligosyltrehalose trehalohydrolase